MQSDANNITHMETTSKKTLNVLSIDYDYFMKFENDDISVLNSFPDGTEQFIGLSDYVWASRLACEYASGEIAKVSCNSDELFEVWKFLMKQRKSVPVLITNSHVHIYDFIKKHMKKHDGLRVVNLDFHHDAYDRTDELNCGNWVNFLDREFSLEYDWVTSDCGWNAAGKKPGILEGRPRFRSISEFRKVNPRFKPDIIFICRSDVWVPPHMDSQFLSFAFDVCGRFKNVRGNTEVLKKRDISKYVLQIKQSMEKINNTYSRSAK